ncbi:DUF1622 domain-containing protein [Methyloceanibacter stevinii]|uniref:DUF1622 domain-containing protein n=1 Tax=Methyloceanibacter stevinii TaxID=1774970 RepID=UPI000AACAADD|nr:DUF1622 domain-containing protein [Methyloceanibacter stevinii]
METDREGAIIPLEESFNAIANYVALGVEFGAVFVVAFGSAQAVIGLFRAIVSGTADSLRGREIWLKFATWILLALEFALAADIVRTAVAPTWDDIWKLAVIAVVRTMLNYFLAKDIAAFTKLERDPQDNSPQNQTPGPASP